MFKGVPALSLPAARAKCLEMAKLANEDPQAGWLTRGSKWLGEGVSQVPSLKPTGTDPGTLGAFSKEQYGQHAGAHASKLIGEGAKGVGGKPITGIKDLTIGQKLRPGWETLKSTASQFKKPLAATGALGLGAYGAWQLGKKLLGGDKQNQSGQGATHNVYYK